MAKLVDKTYGDALFELSIQNNSADVLYEEAKVLVEAIEGDENFAKFLGHPKITKEEKTSFIESVFKDKVSNDLVGLLVLLVKKDRQNYILPVLDHFINRVKEYRKIGIVYVSSAVELDDSQKQKLVEKLENTTSYETFEMHYTVDETLVGGMVIRIGDRVVDSSIRTKINSLSKDLYKIQLT